MKSKVYILSQIADLLVERHGYTREKANRYAELHASKFSKGVARIKENQDIKKNVLKIKDGEYKED